MVSVGFRNSLRVTGDDAKVGEEPPRVDDAGQVPRVEPVRVEVDPGAAAAAARRVRLEETDDNGNRRRTVARRRVWERRVEVPAVDDPELGEPVRGRGSVARGTAGSTAGTPWSWPWPWPWPWSSTRGCVAATTSTSSTKFASPPWWDPSYPPRPARARHSSTTTDLPLSLSVLPPQGRENERGADETHPRLRRVPRA